MTIRHGPSGERPRKKPIEHGAHALPDAVNDIGGRYAILKAAPQGRSLRKPFRAIPVQLQRQP
jgi:hypothetical protein